MDINSAPNVFSALSQPTRLAVFRLLINAGEKGMLAGEIGEKLSVRQNTMSANLAILLNADIIRNERQGRAIRYYANFECIRALLSFLMDDCCEGNPELCFPTNIKQKTLS